MKADLKVSRDQCESSVSCREPSLSERSLSLTCIVAGISVALIWSGLSIRSLWGPEGRWAEIVREMIQSHDYFRPTINGIVYFDKPLLSYWLMAASVRMGGLNEMMLRVPGALAATGTVFIVFLIGRRLFSARTGLLAALILVTSPLFLFWSKIASAEPLNTLSIWIMFWAFLTARAQSRKIYLMVLYTVGAVASFLKGPVAPGVCFFTIGLVSAAEAVLEWSRSRDEEKRLMAIVVDKFFWLLSRQALPGLVLGILLFALLLALPVLFTQSSLSASLMWKENFVRFFLPFDHKDPPYMYAFAIALFSAPWTLFMLCSITRFKLFKASWSHFWTYGSAAGILLFFLVSGSRRGYYILPLIPALALIIADVIKTWVERSQGSIDSKTTSLAAASTSIGLICFGVGLCFVYSSMATYRHSSELLVGGLSIMASLVGLLLLRRQKRLQAISLLISLIVVIDFWGATLGARIGERGRTVKEFARQANMLIDKIGVDNVALFRQDTSGLIFYLGRRSPVRAVESVEDLKQFRLRHPGGLLVLDLHDLPTDMKSYVQELTPILAQDPHGKETKRLAVMQYQ